MSTGTASASTDSAARRARARLRRVLRSPRLPIALLVVVSLASLGARVAWINDPCTAPCRTASSHDLVFDEVYYVNAARRIDGIAVPAGDHYAGDPTGDDPNSEHPQLAKLVIAGSMELFGDDPFGWRFGSLIFGSLAILGMFALVVAAGGSRWLALLSATLMASDNLLLVAGRIATLDIYVVAFMLWAAYFYLRERPLVAGALLGVGACTKLVAPYLVLVLFAFEGARWLAGRHAGVLANARHELVERARALATCVVAAVASYFVLLGLLDRLVTPYDPQTGATITGGPIAHTNHMFAYAAARVSPTGPKGIASYPWDWLIDLKPINYLTVTVTSGGSHVATAHFLGFISPPILLFGLLGLLLAVRGAMRRDKVDTLALMWFLGTWLPFVALSLLWSRTSYLYYMVIVMPGLYIAAARLALHPRMPGWLLGAWLGCVLAAAVLLYPFTALPIPASW